MWSNNTLQARPKDFRKVFFMFPFRSPASVCIYGSKDAADKGVQICLHFQGRNHMCSPAGSPPHLVQAVQKLKAIKGILKLCRGGHLEETGSFKNVWRKVAVPAISVSSLSSDTWTAMPKSPSLHVDFVHSFASMKMFLT